MMRILGRAALALSTSALGVAAVAPARPAVEAPPPPEEPWPFATCGLSPVPLAGELAVSGLPVRARVAWTGRDPAEILACQRAHLERSPVDLQELPGALVARDHLGARTLVVSARRLGPGSTEVVLGEQRGEGLTRPAPPAHVPLPPQLVLATRVDDRSGGQRVTTLGGPCRGALAEVRDALSAALQGAGWSPGPHGVFTRGEATLVVALAGGPAGCTFALRVVGGEG